MATKITCDLCGREVPHSMKQLIPNNQKAIREINKVIEMLELTKARLAGTLAEPVRKPKD